MIWVLIFEFVPNQHGAADQALGSFTQWSFAALLMTLFPTMVTLFPPGYVFLFFCGMMVCATDLGDVYGSGDEGRTA